MIFRTTTEKPITITLDVDGIEHEIKFYPTDLRTRETFYETYEQVKAYKPNDITPTTDENGVSDIELQNARELRRFTEFLAERVDEIYGTGTTDIITGGRCVPHALIAFICETARYFAAASERLIRKYTAADESGVME